MDIKTGLKRVVEGENLSRDEMDTVFNDIMSGNTTDAQTSAFITALRMKGETIEEITGAAEIMREKSVFVRPPSDSFLVDTCGTGGDSSGTFNISTASAFIAAGAGVKVAKHGNRSVSSKCGSADVLDRLGVEISVTPETMEEALEKAGIAFLFAPTLHKAMKYAIGPRKEIGIRTVFNILGPLTNPSRVKNQLIGVYKPELTEVMASVLIKMGSTKGYIVHGLDGFDEISITGRTRVTSFYKGEISTKEITPEDFGFKKAGKREISGDSAEENADILKSVLNGAKGPCRDITLINAGFAIAASDRCKTPKEGIELAEESVDSGNAAKALERLIEVTKAQL